MLIIIRFKSTSVIPTVTGSFILSTAPTIIKFTINFILNIGIEFGFRNWYYIIIKVKLAVNTTAKPICLNIKYFLILLNKAFLISQAFNIKIKIIAFLITVLSAIYFKSS